MSKGVRQDYFGVFRAFSPRELRGILEEAGMNVVRIGGLGSLANFCGKGVVERVLADETLLDEFLDLCDRFDREILPGGPGTVQRAGLVAVAERAVEAGVDDR